MKGRALAKRIAIIGAGGVGGVIAAHLAEVAEVSLVARGTHLEAIVGEGLVFEGLDGSRRRLSVEAVADLRELPSGFDAVLVCVKGNQLLDVVDQVAVAGSPIVFVKNGLPWWYVADLMDVCGGRANRLDPSDHLARSVPRCSAGIAYFGGCVEAPGVVRQTAPGPLVLGHARGAPDRRLSALTGLIAAGGFPCRESPDIRGEIWNKLTVNVALNAVAVLTRRSIPDMLADPRLAATIDALAAEVSALAQAFGYVAGFDRPARQALARPGQLSSTLQDMLAGKAIEFDCLFGVVLDVAAVCGRRAPVLETLAPLIAAAGRVHAEPDLAAVAGRDP
jgi:2-dehydropantoate 2-reductase